MIIQLLPAMAMVGEEGFIVGLYGKRESGEHFSKLSKVLQKRLAYWICARYR